MTTKKTGSQITRPYKATVPNLTTLPEQWVLVQSLHQRWNRCGPLLHPMAYHNIHHWTKCFLIRLVLQQVNIRRICNHHFRTSLQHRYSRSNHELAPLTVARRRPRFLKHHQHSTVFRQQTLPKSLHLAESRKLTGIRRKPSQSRPRAPVRRYSVSCK